MNIINSSFPVLFLNKCLLIADYSSMYSENFCTVMVFLCYFVVFLFLASSIDLNMNLYYMITDGGQGIEFYWKDTVDS